jgi:hypothetical protein
MAMASPIFCKKIALSPNLNPCPMLLFLLLFSLILWAIVGLVVLAWWHDRQAARGRPVVVTRWQVLFGGPVLWFFECLAIGARRARR